METLAHLTQSDINNGALIRLLADAGISDVQEYVKKFHEQTEELIIEDFEHPDSNQPNYNEQVASPTDVKNWISGLLLPFDDPIETPLPEKVDQTLPPPTDLQNWMKRMTPDDLFPTSDIPTVDTTNSNEITAREGNIGSWLNEWSKSLTEQPPPTSIDTWLKGLIPDNMHLPLGKANSAKGRLNSYLNAAQQVLSQHGYDVSNEIKPPTNAPAKIGMSGNVKHMYFLWKTLDKNKDGKITVEDVQIMLQEMGLGFLSKYVAQTLFEMVDSNHDGSLQFRDFIALMSIIKQLIGALGSAKA